jgi:tryptophanyl-tRNA synthetase
MGELNRMTQFKDKSAKAILSNGTAMVPTGIFMYPVLMAGDILLYDADYVPVGSDQKQHVELTRDIAIRMNKKYGDMFKIPEPLITKNGARIMDLVNPSIKMSKSNSNEKGTIFLSDAPRDAYDKIMSSKTDSLNKIIFDPNDQPGISNLLTIYSCLLNVSVKELVTKYTNKNYGEFKKDLANIVSGFLKDFQTKYDNAIRNIGNLNQILEQNASKCEKITNKKIHEIYRLIGLAR